MFMEFFKALICEKFIGAFNNCPEKNGAKIMSDELKDGIERIFKKMEDECTKRIERISPDANSFQVNGIIATEFMETLCKKYIPKFEKIPNRAIYPPQYNQPIKAYSHWPLNVAQECRADYDLTEDIESVIRAVENECTARIDLLKKTKPVIDEEKIIKIVAHVIDKNKDGLIAEITKLNTQITQLNKRISQLEKCGEEPESCEKEKEKITPCNILPAMPTPL